MKLMDNRPVRNYPVEPDCCESTVKQIEEDLAISHQKTGKEMPYYYIGLDNLYREVHGWELPEGLARHNEAIEKRGFAWSEDRGHLAQCRLVNAK